jgi:amino acid adenylation domain-containing protein
VSVVATFEDLLGRSNLTGRQFLIYAGQRLHPGLALYNSVYAIKWPGMDPQRFKLAWQTLVDSCDALRTVVNEVDGVPQQRVVPPFATEVDCVRLPQDLEPERAIKDWISERLRRPLVLTQRVFDTALLCTGEHEYHWFLHIHHIVVDGAAVQILIHRITELYSDVRKSADALPQFSDYAATACALRHSEQYAVDKIYWQTLLRDLPETPRFYGVDAYRSTVQERVVLSLDVTTSTLILSIARSLATPSLSEHAAAANLFNAAFAAYLQRVSGSKQVSIGVTFHNRSSDVGRRTIGLFMEVLPLALGVRPHDSLITLMGQVTVCASQALKHRRYSIGHSARAPAFSGLFNYMLPIAAPLVALDIGRIHAGHGSTAISLSVAPRGDRYDLWFDVNADVAASSDACRLADQFRTLLEDAARYPDRPLMELALVPPLEARKILEACSGPSLTVEPGLGGCLAQFEHQAAVRPDSVALRYNGTDVSYVQLNRKANRLAHKLRTLGTKRGKRVGICLERSVEMVVAMLAVLKSGAAYVPLDPTYPAARLRTMLIDADPAVLVTTRRIFAELPTCAARSLYIEQDDDSFLTTHDNPGTLIESADVAYVIYTSGSTGTPKGVLVTHGGVCNHLAWRSSFFPLDSSDRCLQTASLSFDDSVWEILEPLSAGACVVLTRPRFEYDSAYLVKLMIEERLTVACFVPSLLRAVIDEQDIGCCRSLRRLTTGGEGLSVSLQQRVLQRLPSANFYNGYGTTEGTIASVYWKCVDSPGQHAVPIGRPIANTQVYVLDPKQQLVPPGLVGEIYLGGAGIAQGYLNLPELTAERFVEDRFGGIANAKLYRTGDLGVLRADGVFEFAGRIDEQVKIRGVRVELGDIEAALLDHPGVRSAAVVCDETASGKRLIAYVVPRSAPISIADLRAFLRDRLPPALVPNLFEHIAALPLTPSGKLERRSLPAVQAAAEPENYVAPRNDFETRLVGMWEEVLQARPIGIRDDFFALGGHSLSAVAVAAAIERSLGRSLSPGLLFEAPTIETLSRHLSAPASNESRGALVRLSQGQPGAPLFLVHHVSGDITAYRDLAQFLGAGRSVYGLRAPELDTNERPLDRVEAMASRYVRDIRALQSHGPYLIGGHSAGAHIAFEIAQQLCCAGQSVGLLAILEADARTRSGRRSLADTLRYQIDGVRKLPWRQRGVYLWRTFARWAAHQTTVAADSRVARPVEGKNAVWAATERAVRQYRPAPYPGQITLFRATDRSVTGTYGRTLGWARLARGGTRVIDVPGSHSTVLRPGSEPPMAARLRACLEEMTAKELAMKNLET